MQKHFKNISNYPIEILPDSNTIVSSKEYLWSRKKKKKTHFKQWINLAWLLKGSLRPEELREVSELVMFCREDKLDAASAKGLCTWGERHGHNQATPLANQNLCNLQDIWSSLLKWNQISLAWLQSRAFWGSSWLWLHQGQHQLLCGVAQGIVDWNYLFLFSLEELALVPWCRSRRWVWWLWWAEESQLRFLSPCQSHLCCWTRGIRNRLCCSSCWW